MKLCFTASSYEPSDAARGRTRLERGERGLGREAPRLDRVVHALEPRDVDHADAVAAQQQPRRVQPRRQRVEAAARNRLRAPRDALAALEQLADLRMGLQLLQQIVRGQLDVAIVESDDHADREHVVAHRVEERAAELAVLLRRAQRPAHRVDHVAQRPLDLPDLLHAELPHLRLGAREPEAVERDAGEMALRSLGEHRHLRDEVGARLEVAQLLPVAVAALVSGADADDAAVRDEQLLGGGLGQDHRAALLRLLGEPAAEPREREDDVAVVAHRRRRRDPHRGTAREHVDRFAVHRPVRRELLEPVAVAEEPAHAIGLTTAPESRCEPGCLPFSTSATGTSPSRSAVSGCSSSSWPKRIAQASPAGPPPTIRTPTSIRSSTGSVGSPTNSLALNGGG